MQTCCCFPLGKRRTRRRFPLTNYQLDSNFSKGEFRRIIRKQRTRRRFPLTNYQLDSNFSKGELLENGELVATFHLPIINWIQTFQRENYWKTANSPPLSTYQLSVGFKLFKRESLE